MQIHDMQSRRRARRGGELRVQAIQKICPAERGCRVEIAEARHRQRFEVILQDRAVREETLQGFPDGTEAAQLGIEGGLDLLGGIEQRRKIPYVARGRAHIDNVGLKLDQRPCVHDSVFIKPVVLRFVEGGPNAPAQQQNIQAGDQLGRSRTAQHGHSDSRKTILAFEFPLDLLPSANQGSSV